MRTGSDSLDHDNAPWQPSRHIIEQMQAFLLTGEFPFDYELPRYMCQICRLRGNATEMICCDGQLGLSDQPCCGVSFHKVCADPLRKKPWGAQDQDTDNFLCDRCYDELSDDEDDESTEEHASDCECGACVSEYIDEDGNLADFVVPDDEVEEQHEPDCNCEFCRDMRKAHETWANLRLEDAPTPFARGVKRAADAADKRRRNDQ